MKTVIYIIIFICIICGLAENARTSEAKRLQHKSELMALNPHKNEEHLSRTSNQAKIKLRSEQQEDRMNGYAYLTSVYQIEIAFIGDFNSSTGGQMAFKNLDTDESFSLTGISFEHKELCNGIIKEGKSLDELIEEVKKEKNTGIFGGIWVFNYKTANAYLSGKRHLLWIMGSLNNHGKPEVKISIKTLEGIETVYYTDATAEQLETLVNI